MKYQAPPGEVAGAPYLDGNRNAGIRGSVVPGKAVEHPQRELAHLIDFAGLTPSDTDLEQVRKAIEALIAAATGGGDTSQFLLVSQARARLPIFPEILSIDGRMNVSSPAAGTILVPPTVAFQHRGIFPMSTSDYTEGQRTFATLAGKTYHLRWTQAGGFALRDLADADYNPGALPESAPVFDSLFDDMLVARVMTNGSNVAAITNLSNKDRLFFGQGISATNYQAANTNNSRGDILASLNWARTPRLKGFSCIYLDAVGGSTQSDFDIAMYALGGFPAPALSEIPATRYEIAYTMQYDHSAAFTHQLSAEA